MTPAGRLAAVIELYDWVVETAKPSDQIMQDYFRQRKFIGSKDRKAIAETLYHLLRHYARLGWWAKETGMPENGRSMLLLWLILGEGKNAVQLVTLFDGSNYGPSQLSSREKELSDHLADESITNSMMPVDVRTECPSWVYAGLRRAFQDFPQQMEALQNEAPLDLRVNSLHAERAAVLKTLRHEGLQATLTPYAPFGIRVQGRPSFSANPLYQQGIIEVQDEGSQLLALLCGVRPGEWVVDFCAGAGGKTLALAAMMQNKGRIWACDVDQSRLENARKRLRRSGIHCVQTKTLDDEQDDWVRKHKNMADCVLIDAPCSGMGTWRRNPFSRWQNLGPSLKQLVELQHGILSSASRLVKSGGRLLYATCSMLPEENHDQVERFIKEHPYFHPVPLAELWQQTGHAMPEHPAFQEALQHHSLQLTPLHHGTDGFFIAALKRE